MDSKPWYKSLTTDALVVMALLVLAPQVGVDLSGEEGTMGEMVELVLKLATIAVALYGRARAKSRLTLT